VSRFSREIQEDTWEKCSEKSDYPARSTTKSVQKSELKIFCGIINRAAFDIITQHWATQGQKRVETGRKRWKPGSFLRILD
jgi:hypothetical protein